MKRVFLFLFLIFFVFVGITQNNHDLKRVVEQLPGVFLNVTVNSKKEVQDLMNDFSIERGDVTRNGDQYYVKIWMTKVYVDLFMEKEIPYTIDSNSLSISEPKPALTMATTVDQMGSWNRYPTYSVYLQMMNNFQTNFPELCKIDTILANTTLNHKILAARISTTLGTSQNKPAFLYSSSMHGDEICGYVLMLRLIDYILNNQSDTLVKRILDHVDLYICPLENPDGTFPISNTTVSGSVRSNAAGYDLNRSYPIVGYATQPNVSISEITSMLQFIEEKKITMAANFHGGAELYNYAWDSYTSSQLEHPDQDWWIQIGNKFLDTIRVYAPSTYFDDEGGVTNGGDWYVVTGSKLDCLNYYHQCRDVTIEISLQKQTNSTNLPNYWNYLNRSLLDYIYQSSLGISGLITDSLTQNPLEALVFISSHDNNQSCVYSFLPSGKYYRPIQTGSYNVTFSSPGYRSKTLFVTVQNGDRVIQDVSLVPNNYGVSETDYDASISIYPNPSKDYMKIDFSSLSEMEKRISIISMKGDVLKTDITYESQTTIDLKDLTSSIYFVRIEIKGEVILKKVVVKK